MTKFIEALLLEAVVEHWRTLSWETRERRMLDNFLYMQGRWNCPPNCSCNGGE